MSDVMPDAVLSEDGNRDSIWLFSNGQIPVLRKPAFKFSLDLSCTLTIKEFSRLRNSSFGIQGKRLPLPFSFQSEMIFRHAIFFGLKQATSKGWAKWVAFGGNDTKAMLFCCHACSTAILMCEDKLSPITTCFPDLFF